MISEYKRWKYRDGGRGEVENSLRYVDCWGLVRVVRHEKFGMPLLPLFSGVDPSNKELKNRAASDVLAGLAPCEPKDGAVVMCWAGRLAIHCGIVVSLDGRHGVLEADKGVDVRWTPWKRFSGRYTKVECFE